MTLMAFKIGRLIEIFFSLNPPLSSAGTCDRKSIVENHLPTLSRRSVKKWCLWLTATCGAEHMRFTVGKEEWQSWKKQQNDKTSLSRFGRLFFFFFFSVTRRTKLQRVGLCFSLSEVLIGVLFVWQKKLIKKLLFSRGVMCVALLKC